MASPRITVILVDDHPVVLRGISSFLETDKAVKICALAGDTQEAMATIGNHLPDVVLLDISLKKLSGIDLLKDIKKISPGTKAVMYTNHNNANYIQRSIRQGARGYVLKSDSLQEVVEAIHFVAEGGLYLSKNLPKNTLESLIQGNVEQDSCVNRLTPREYEVANLICQGQNVQDIAKALYISPKTVWVHRSKIMEKFSCTKSNELIVRLFEYFPQS